jgi:hypothetical protein
MNCDGSGTPRKVPTADSENSISNVDVALEHGTDLGFHFVSLTAPRHKDDDCAASDSAHRRGWQEQSDDTAKHLTTGAYDAVSDRGSVLKSASRRARIMNRHQSSVVSIGFRARQFLVQASDVT